MLLLPEKQKVPVHGITCNAVGFELDLNTNLDICLNLVDEIILKTYWFINKYDNL